jgi:hypothetical protein
MRTIVPTFISVAMLVVSCDSLKNDTPEETAEYILESLQDNDVRRIKELLVNEKDSLRASNEGLRGEIHKLYSDTSESNGYQRRYLDEFQKTYEKGEEIGVNWSNVDFLRFDFEVKTSDKNEQPESIRGKIIFKSNNTEFQLKVSNILKFTDGWKNVKFGRLVDILKYKKEVAETPYKPYGLAFTSCNWEYKYMSTNTFSNFFVTFKNGTEDNFDNLKFKVTISTRKYGLNTEVFSRTIQQNQNIYAGDVLRFEVLELRDFYVGVNIADKNNFYWNAEVVDARPHPKRLEEF